VNDITVLRVAALYSEGRSVAEPAKSLSPINWMDQFELYLTNKFSKPMNLNEKALADIAVYLI
jgi:hypothetical protein